MDVSMGGSDCGTILCERSLLSFRFDRQQRMESCFTFPGNLFNYLLQLITI